MGSIDGAVPKFIFPPQDIDIQLMENSISEEALLEVEAEDEDGDSVSDWNTTTISSLVKVIIMDVNEYPPIFPAHFSYKWKLNKQPSKDKNIGRVSVYDRDRDSRLAFSIAGTGGCNATSLSIKKKTGEIYYRSSKTLDTVCNLTLDVFDGKHNTQGVVSIFVDIDLDASTTALNTWTTFEFTTWDTRPSSTHVRNASRREDATERPIIFPNEACKARSVFTYIQAVTTIILMTFNRN